MTRRVLVSDAKTTDLETIEDAFEGLDVSIEATVAHREDVLVEEAAGADALIVDANTPVSAHVLQELEHLVVVGRAGIGVDNVAIDAADARGVVVVNVPDYCIDEVSTHAIGLLLSCLRRLGVYDHAVKDGDWEWTVGQPIQRLAGSTVGLIAFGKIARRMAEKLRGFDVDVLAYDPYVDTDVLADAGVEAVGFTTLLERADAVSIHAPLTDETHGMFDDGAFAAMRENAILVNTARGPIVDENALVRAFESGHIDAAGLDVRENEPPGDAALHERDDVVLSPHVGWYSEASRVELSESLAGDVARVLRGEEPRNRVDPASGWF